jgi:isoaspartyl peptidase/L-asparaginase-like protein (Ntn-hydrolase superfamily)
MNNLQGEAQFLTGGKVREPKGRIGVIPIPTVTVWMREDMNRLASEAVVTALFVRQAGQFTI